MPPYPALNSPYGMPGKIYSERDENLITSFCILTVSFTVNHMSLSVTLNLLVKIIISGY